MLDEEDSITKDDIRAYDGNMLRYNDGDVLLYIDGDKPSSVIVE